MRIRIREGRAADVERWAAEMNRRSDEARETLRAEGVVLEAVFLDRQADGDHLIYVINAPDFEHATAVARGSTAPIDVVHRAFKDECWEARVPLRPLIDFGPIGSGIVDPGPAPPTSAANDGERRPSAEPGV